MTELGDRAVGELLSDEQLRRIDAYWRAANYLCVGLIYLRENPLLREPLAASHIKAMLLGHWDTAPGQNFIDARLNPVIPVRDLDLIYLSGREHGAAALVANTYLEGTYRKLYPQIAQYEAGAEAPDPAIFLSWRHSGPRLAAVSGLDPRGWGARRVPEPRLRPGARQRRVDRRLRGVRARGAWAPNSTPTAECCCAICA